MATNTVIRASQALQNNIILQSEQLYTVIWILYINVMNNISVDCDCDSHPADPEMLDVGIFASTDPVALDQACLDYVYNMKPEEGNDNRPLIERIESRNGRHTVEYAEKIGLGTRDYELVEID